MLRRIEKVISQLYNQKNILHWICDEKRPSQL